MRKFPARRARRKRQDAARRLGEARSYKSKRTMSAAIGLPAARSAAWFTLALLTISASAVAVASTPAPPSPPPTPLHVGDEVRAPGGAIAGTACVEKDEGDGTYTLRLLPTDAERRRRRALQRHGERREQEHLRDRPPAF